MTAARKLEWFSIDAIVIPEGGPSFKKIRSATLGSTGRPDTYAWQMTLS